MRRLVAAGLLMLGALLTAAPMAGAAPVPPGTIVEAPAWSIGSEWHYSDGYAVKVTSVSTGGAAVFTRMDSPSEWYMREGFIRTDSADGDTTDQAIYRTIPNTAGYRLSSTSPLTFQREYLSNGKLMVHASSWTVEGRETITVPAGSFDCWVIVWRTRSLKSDWTGFERWWYSPQVQHYVRMEYKYGPGEPGSRVLMRYHLGDGAQAPIASNGTPAMAVPAASAAAAAGPSPAPVIPVQKVEAAAAPRKADPAPAMPAAVTGAPVIPPAPPPVPPAQKIEAAPAPKNVEPAPVMQKIAVPAAAAAPSGLMPAKLEINQAPLPVPSVKQSTPMPVVVDQKAVPLVVAPASEPKVEVALVNRVETTRMASPAVPAEKILSVLKPVIPEQEVAPVEVASLSAPKAAPSDQPVVMSAPAAATPAPKPAMVAAVPIVVASSADLKAIAPLQLADAEKDEEKALLQELAQVDVADEPRSKTLKNDPVEASSSPYKSAQKAQVARAPEPQGGTSGPWHAQVGSVPDADRIAVALKKILAANPDARDLPNGVVSHEIEGRGIFYRAWIGSYETAKYALALCETLKVGKAGCAIFRNASLSVLASTLPKPVSPVAAETASAKPQAKPAKAAVQQAAAAQAQDKFGAWHAQIGSARDAAYIRDSLKKVLAANPEVQDMPSGVSAHEIGGRGTFYRGWIGSYDRAREALALCDTLKVGRHGCAVFKADTLEARVDGLALSGEAGNQDRSMESLLVLAGKHLRQ